MLRRIDIKLILAEKKGQNKKGRRRIRNGNFLVKLLASLDIPDCSRKAMFQSVMSFNNKTNQPTSQQTDVKLFFHSVFHLPQTK